jgi:predicted glycoside hydrolase/deacetylase ChbG (UPF0249 family)/nucleoside-diphosphate-sugar epimerase
VVGTNGCLFADFVRGTVMTLPGPGASGISKVINPYSQAGQTITKTTRALFTRVFKKQKSYPGLAEIIGAFYESVRSDGEEPVSYTSILETVGICEDVHDKLKEAEADESKEAAAALKRRESCLSMVDLSRGGVLVTGGTGMLGKAVAIELRSRNYRTRITSRKIPSATERIPGVEYLAADLGGDITPVLFDGISMVVHCAAETAGGKEAHARNSIGATRNILTAMANAGVSKFLHISSIAVLRASRETGRPVDETTPLVQNSEDRGPYVWGKAESEHLAMELGRELGIEVRVIRPGPLVDYDAFEAPGRLGKEVGRYFVYVGSRGNRLSLCDVRTASEVIRAYVEDFDSMPEKLNLVEPDAPTRGHLVSRLLNNRPDLKAVGLPSFFLRAVNPAMKLLQRLLFCPRSLLSIRCAGGTSPCFILSEPGNATIMLIINADDYGMGEDINRAIVRCFHEGICTNTTIMPTMPGFDEACALAFEKGFQENVGMHLVLIGGVPLTADIRQVEKFCTEEGEFYLSRESPIFSLSTREQYALAAEIRGQIRKCRERGISISHVDSHHHVHTEWGIAKVLIPIVREEGIPFVRIARNLVKNREIGKRVYKHFYNAILRWSKLRATEYFGSVDEYLLFLDRKKEADRKREADRIIEVMIHPHYKGNELYLTDSMDSVQYIGMMGKHLETEGTVSFRGLHPYRPK